MNWKSRLPLKSPCSGKATEQHLEKKTKKSAQVSSVAEGNSPDADELAYYDLPENKSVLLNDIFTDIVLYLYTEQVSKEPIFRFALEEGIKKGGRNLFAYSHSIIQKYFPKEIQNRDLFTHRIKRNEVFSLIPVLEKCTDSLLTADTPRTLQILLDFSETEEFNDILAVKKLLLSKKESGIPVSGILAVNMGRIDHSLIQTLAEGIPKIIVSTGKETTLSFAHHTFPGGSVSVVPQSTIDDVVKKSLEPVVLSLLDKPISGTISFMRSITGITCSSRRHGFIPSCMISRRKGIWRSGYRENPNYIVPPKKGKNTSARNSMISGRYSSTYSAGEVEYIRK